MPRDRDEIFKLADKWLAGDRADVIAQFPTLKPSEALVLNARIMRLFGDRGDYSRESLESFINALADGGY